VCVGKARRVRFKSRGRRLDSIENKRNDTGLRFVLQQPEEGHHGFLIWQGDHLPARIDWNDPVVKYGLEHRIKYARLIRRPASSPRAQGADCQGDRYFVQLALSGVPSHKPKHPVGTDTIGLDLGPSTIASVPREGEANLVQFCEELVHDARAIRRLQRQMDRQRRAANPDNYDAKGRIKKGSKKKLIWKSSKGYEATRRRKATKERKLAAHRKSLHGRKVHELVAVGNTMVTEQISYKGWQKRYGRSVGLRAPGMFIEMLRRTWASHGRHPARDPHPFHEAVPVLPWLWAMYEKTALAAASSVPVRHRAGAARPVLGVSGRLSRSSRSRPLVCEVMSFPGKVRRRACGQHTSECKNARMRGRRCPKAWVSLVPERVCPKVGANRHKSPSSSSDEGNGKRGTNAQNPPRLSRGSLQLSTPICSS
jgi:hypothetical protein